MSNPTDTLSLMYSLRYLAEQITGIGRSIDTVLQEMKIRGVEDVSRQFADALIAAGMPAGSAFRYAEEYEANIAITLRGLGTALEQTDRAKIATEAMTHIARVAPARAPLAGKSNGEPTLMLT